MLTNRRNDDAGMTLAELLVGMSLLLVVATLATKFFVTQSNASTRTLNASFATSNGRTTLTAVATELRYADTPTSQPGYPAGRFLTATPTQVVFFSNIRANRSGGATRTPPVKIDLHVSGTQLVEQDYLPKTAYTTYPANYDSSYAANYPATPTTTTVLAPRLSNLTSVFSYCAVPTATNVCPAMTASDLGTIASVKVSLVVPDRTGANPQSFQTTVSITGASS